MSHNKKIPVSTYWFFLHFLTNSLKREFLNVNEKYLSFLKSSVRDVSSRGILYYFRLRICFGYGYTKNNLCIFKYKRNIVESSLFLKALGIGKCLQTSSTWVAPVSRTVSVIHQNFKFVVKDQHWGFSNRWPSKL